MTSKSSAESFPSSTSDAKRMCVCSLPEPQTQGRRRPSLLAWLGSSLSSRQQQQRTWRQQPRSQRHCQWQ